MFQQSGLKKPSGCLAQRGKIGIGEREGVQRTQWVYCTKDADTEKGKEKDVTSSF